MAAAGGRAWIAWPDGSATRVVAVAGGGVGSIGGPTGVPIALAATPQELVLATREQGGRTRLWLTSAVP